MMMSLRIVTLAGLLLILAGFGCKPQAGGSGQVTLSASGPLPAGWKTYTPPEGDFSVAVPGDPSNVIPQKEKDQNVRTYVFRKGNVVLNVMMYERTGRAMQSDTPQEIRSDPQVIPASIRDVQLDGMTGLEFR